MGDSLLSSGSNPSGLRLDKTTALAIGFGLHNAWVCTAMYSTHAVFGVSSFTLPGIRGGSFSFLYLASIAAFCVIMFLAAGFDQKLASVSRSRKVMAIGAGATCLGTLLALVPPLSPGLDFAFESFAGVITGFGSAVLMLYWGIAFAREKASTIAIAGSIAVALGFALNTLFLQSIPAPFGGVVSAVIPLLEFLIISAISPAPPTRGYVLFNALPTSKSRLGMTLVGPMALVGFALGVLKQASVQTTLGGMITPATFITLLLAGSLTISLFTFYAFIQKTDDWGRFFRFVVPAVTCVSLLVSLLVLENADFANLFLLVAYIFIEALVWVHYAYLSHRFHLSPIFLFGLSRSILTLSMLAGALGVSYTAPLLAQLPLGDEGLIIIPLVLIAMGYALMPRESDLARRIVQCPAVRLVELELEENLGILNARQPVTAVDDEPHANEADASAKHEGQMEAASPAGGAGVPAAISSDAPADSSASEARKAMLQKNEAEGAAPVGKFTRKVKKVAKTYLLTERETDILFELAKGNSPTYIQEKYYISAGTVKTHIRNVYRKLDVHKRNDLLRIIENTEVDD